jgi:lipoprotein-releasing system permease protein
MINKFTIWLSVKCWFSSPKEKPVFIMSLFGIIGITIGVAALVIVMSIMNGFRIELEKNIRGVASDISISPSDQVFINDEDEIINKLSADKNIINVNKIILGQGLLASESGSCGIIFRGMDIKTLGLKNQIFQNLVAGNFNNFSNNNSISIGMELAIKFRIRIGDRLRLILPSVNNAIIGSIPRMKEFEVISIFHSKLYEYDIGTVIINYDIASKLLSSNTHPNLIEIDIKPENDLLEYTSKISEEFSDYPINVTNWQESNAQFLNALKIERVAMFCVLSLIVFVAMFNVLSGLFMTVKDKKYDIAILRSLGVSRSEILISFMLYGVFIGFIGVIIGITVGHLIASNIESVRYLLESFSGYNIFEPAIYFLSYLPSKVLISDLLLISAMTLTVSLLGSIYPAYKAANMSVIEALRYE